MIIASSRLFPSAEIQDAVIPTAEANVTGPFELCALFIFSPITTNFLQVETSHATSSRMSSKSHLSYENADVGIEPLTFTNKNH